MVSRVDLFLESLGSGIRDLCRTPPWKPPYFEQKEKPSYAFVIIRFCIIKGEPSAQDFDLFEEAMVGLVECFGDNYERCKPDANGLIRKYKIQTDQGGFKEKLNHLVEDCGFEIVEWTDPF